MAKKRAQVDATLTATACSDIFTQDVEKMRDLIAKDDPDVIDTTTVDEQKATDHGKKDEPAKEEADNGRPVDFEKLSKTPPDNQELAKSGFEISAPQLKRFHAIAKENNWTPDDIDRLLFKHNYVTAKQISWKVYKEMIEELEAGVPAEFSQKDDVPF